MRKRDAQYLGKLGYGKHMWRMRKHPSNFFVNNRGPEDKFTGFYVNWHFSLKSGRQIHISKVRSYYDFSMNSNTIKIGCQRFDRHLVEQVIKEYRLPITVERRKKAHVV